MTTRIAKVGVIIVAIASVLFAGASMSTFVSGPNWTQKVRDLSDAHGVRFEPSATKAGLFEAHKWTAKTANDEPIASGVPISKAVVDSYKKILQQRNTEMGDLQKREQLLQGRPAAIEKIWSADLPGLKQRSDAFDAELKEAYAAIEQMSQSIQKRQQEISKIDQTTEKRREEVFRLKGELDALRADRFHIGELRQQFQDLINRIDGNLARLRLRSQQLRQAEGT